MRFFTARRLALAALVPALLVLSVIPGCSNGREGERCGDPDGTVTNNSDCGSGLVCTAFTSTDGSNETVGRCCYPDHVSDSRCQKSSGPSAFVPTAGSGGAAAGSGGAATGSGGAVAGSTSSDAGASAVNGGAAGAASMTPDLPAGAGGS